MTALAIHTNYDWKKQMWTRHPIIWAMTIVLILLVIILTEIWTIILNKWRSSKISFFTKTYNLCELLDGKDVSFLQLHFLYSLHFFTAKRQPWSFHSVYCFSCVWLFRPPPFVPGFEISTYSAWINTPFSNFWKWYTIMRDICQIPTETRFVRSWGLSRYCFELTVLMNSPTGHQWRLCNQKIMLFNMYLSYSGLFLIDLSVEAGGTASFLEKQRIFHLFHDIHSLFLDVCLRWSDTKYVLNVAVGME